MGKSKLFFVPNHYAFDEEGIEATEEMLDYKQYHFIGPSKKKVPFEIEKVFKNALNGLTQIGKFTIKVSIMVDLKEKFLLIPETVWAVICLNNEIIYKISHDTRFKSITYQDIFDWPELGEYNLEKSYLSKVKKMQIVTEFSSEKSWQILFRNRLEKHANKILKDSNETIKQKLLLINDANKILDALI